MNKLNKFIHHIVPKNTPKTGSAKAFAPSNIALVKYWGKRDTELNLPLTSSLSISLDNLGTETRIASAEQDRLSLNGKALEASNPFYKRLFEFVNLVRTPDQKLAIDTNNNIPTAAGLASSASGFAALVKALDQLYGWNLDTRHLSLLARVGSGSACRSIETGFVKWAVGTQEDGLDSYAQQLPTQWPNFRVGIITVSESQKPMSSREAMIITRETAKRYQKWPDHVAQDLPRMETAIADFDFDRVGQIAENNALEMHACMADAKPTISFSSPETLAARKAVWQARCDGIGVYFTQDAGPNIKCLFLEKDWQALLHLFPNLEVVTPFKG